MSKSSKFHELESLNAIYKILGHSDKNLLGNDEDAVCIKFNDGYLVINVDGWVESSDMAPYMNFEMAGYRALVNSASDVISKGVKAQAIVVSISTYNQSFALKIVKGIKQACDDFDINYLGGDLNESKDTIIDVTTFGFTNQIPIIRGGAKINDLVCWLGPELGIIGYSLKVLLGIHKGKIVNSLNNYGYPKLFSEILKIGPLSAAMDCSDGLAFTLYKIADKSGKKIILNDLNQNYSWIDTDMTSEDINKCIFYSGEELGIVFTCPIETKLPNEVLIIGTVVKGNGVFLKDQIMENKGWEHFT